MSFSFRNDGNSMCRRGFRIRLSIIAILFGWIGLTDCVSAADWKIVPQVDVGTQYQSNPRFRVDSQDEESATGLFVDAKLPVTFANRRTEASLLPHVQRSFYRKEVNQDIERENYYLQANVGRRMPRTGFGASAGYSNRDLLSSEFDSGDGSGTPVLFDNRETRLFLNPYWSYQLSPANSVGVNGGVSQTRFDDRTLQRFDYDYNNLSATFTHILNEKNSVQLQANFNKFDSFQPLTTVENDSTTNGLSAIFTNYFSESLSFIANLGWARTQSTVMFPSISVPGLGDLCFDFTPPPCINKTDSTNFVGDLALQKRSETIGYSVSIGQSITPNSNGAQVVRRTLRGQFNKNFRRNFSAALNLSAYRQTDVGATDDEGNNLNRKRDYANMQANVRWQFRRELALSASYRYTWSRQSGFIFFRPGTVINNTVFIGLSYKGRGWR
jgi:hypothetical protein